MRLLFILLTTIFSLSAAANCPADDRNCVMKSGGAGYSKQGPGCADCTKFLNNKRLPEKGSGREGVSQEHPYQPNAAQWNHPKDMLLLYSAAKDY